MNKKYILACDQGTTSSRSLVLNSKGKVLAISSIPYEQIYPEAGWVEHNPELIWKTQKKSMKKAIAKSGIEWQDVACIGLTNQRETAIVWNKNTGEAIYNAIVWQDMRTAGYCEELKTRGLSEYVKSTTGLVIDSYFSASKVQWILNNVEGAKELAKSGDLLFGTVDSWLLWKMSKGKVHVTDHSNASRTMLYDIHKLCWDEKLLDEMQIPKSMLPEVKSNGEVFGHYKREGNMIPICSILGDQQSALFGQLCLQKGMVKNTYGTGCFMLMNTGDTVVDSKNGLINTIAWNDSTGTTYALEGSVFVAGAAVQWLRDGLEIIESADETESMATSSSDKGVFFVPAFAGLGAPHWDMDARGAIFGLTRDTNRNDIARATLEALAYQTCDLLNAMKKDVGVEIPVLKVDGGASANNYLMQFQADMSGLEVERPVNVESTALGAAYMAGLNCGMWTMDDIYNFRKIENTFEPQIGEGMRERAYAAWLNVVERTKKPIA